MKQAFLYGRCIRAGLPISGSACDLGNTRAHGPTFILHHIEILGAVANSLMVLNHFREYVGAPDAEYGIEIEIGPFVSSGEPLYYYGFFSEQGVDRYKSNDLSLLLPRLSVASSNEFEDLLSMIDTDLYDGIGIRRQRAGQVPLKVHI